jgi:hypothetical protein
MFHGGLQRAGQIANQAQDAAWRAGLALENASRARLALNIADRDEVSDPFVQDMRALTVQA